MAGKKPVKLGQAYLKNVEGKLESVEAHQSENFRRAGILMADAYEQDRLIRPGQTSVDLGSAPGSWSQVLRERLAGPGGTVVKERDPAYGQWLETRRGDVTEAERDGVVHARESRTRDGITAEGYRRIPVAEAIGRLGLFGSA